MQRVPARIGDPLAAVETPALVVDLDAFEHNLDLMANAVRGSGLALRPHAKSHKCPDIAKAQVARGAVGICCQKVDEAAAFVAAGIADVLVTNEVVAPAKIARLAALAQSATIGVLVDDARVIADCPPRPSQAGGTLHVLRRDRRRRASLRRRARRRRASTLAQAIDGGAGARAFADCTRIRAPRSTCARPTSAAPRSPRRARWPRKRRALIEEAGVRVPGRHRRGHRHVAARARQPRVHRAAAGLVRVHGCRLRAQRARARRARVRAQPVRARAP